MTANLLELHVADGTYCVCRLPIEADLPVPPRDAPFWSVSISEEGITIVCDERVAPPVKDVEGGWRLLRVRGPLPFSMTGVLAAVSTPLAKAGIPIFVVSTYETDYVMIKQDLLEKAVRVLTEAGMRVNASVSATLRRDM